MLQMENDSLKRHKAHVLALLKGDEDHKAHNQILQSQVEELLSEKAELQRQHQTIEAGLKADLERASNKMKMIPVNHDPQKGKVEKLTAELTLAYNQQKRYKAQYEDQSVKIEKLQRLVWEMDRKAPPSYSLMQAYENQRYILFSLIGIEGIRQQLSQGTFE